MKIWVDDIRKEPEGYLRAKSVWDAIKLIQDATAQGIEIEILDLDHDSGDYNPMGGDYIRILDWLEISGISVPIRLHTMNPVGRDNMMSIIQRNGWRVVR